MLNFFITTSFNNCRVKLHSKNQIYETLMGKGFQRTTKKNQNEINFLNCFVFVNELQKSGEKDGSLSTSK